MLHVTNRHRWNRTKGVTAFAFWLGGLLAIGGENTTSEPHYDVAIVCMAICAGLMASIYRHRQ